MKNHLILRKKSIPEKYKSPHTPRGRKPPKRDRNFHGGKLINRIAEIKESIHKTDHLVPFQNGYYLDFEGEPDYFLNLKSLETDGREVVAVKTIENKEVATVFLNDKSLTKLESKIDKYQNENTPKGEARNKPLVESISEINLASIRSLWTDNIPFPKNDEEIHWEVWLRIGATEAEREAILQKFRESAQEERLLTSSKEIRFPESTIILLGATARQISQIFYPLNILSELRKAVDTADFFLGLSRDDEQDWIDDAVERIELPSEDAPSVCLLDTGVNYEHPLLRDSMNPAEMDAYKREKWLITDHHGHGTGMAGLSLHGDLVEVLASDKPITLQHRIESVKLYWNEDENPPELYGEITKECVARAELFAPQRKRVICLAITAPEKRNQGIPSSWSASIDAISSASFEDIESPRLFFLASGDAQRSGFVNYPDSNLSDEIHDPAQSFNSITVGAYTDKVIIDENSVDFGRQPIAKRGGLSPHSTTGSLNEWANKPDIVLEGGNLASNIPDPLETPSLRLLTTNSEWQNSHFIDFGETSAAVALASRMGALILAKYPNLRPETVRGLMIHSATWTEQMLNEYPTNNQINKKNLLRCYGYGVPNLDDALYSVKNSVTLIAEDRLQPYIKESSKDAKLNKMNLHEIPWARDILIGLGEEDVEMRVTLSYFIEPNPNGKGYKNKHRYTSHQLRFATMKSDENKVEFRKTINKEAREKGEDFTSSGGDNSGWVLGSKIREKGSIHSDIWKGTAANLATKNVIAIYPVGGWWKELKRQEKWNSVANYSLIVSIKTKKTNNKIYNAIKNQILIPIEI